MRRSNGIHRKRIVDIKGGNYRLKYRLLHKLSLLGIQQHRPMDSNYNNLLDQLLVYFEKSSPLALQIKSQSWTKRQQLQAYFTVAQPSLPEEVLRLSDGLYALEAKEKSVVASASLASMLDDFPATQFPVAAQCSLWQGDITTLEIDAIVNAANSQLLGCFSPFHRCIDNAINTVAGPRLREACFVQMKAQGHDEPTGKAKITDAYYLPSKYVLHTVGPIVRNDLPSKEQETLLASCYEQCLTLADKQGDIRSVAFCCISTGVFGYPPHLAVKVALSAVNQWLKQHPTSLIQHVVFNVFSDADYQIYQEAITTWN